MQNIAVLPSSWRATLLVAALATFRLAAAAGAQVWLPDPRAPRSVPVSELHFELVANPALFAARQIDVQLRLHASEAGELLLSMPAWTPGAYELAQHARFVSSFSATKAAQPLHWDKLDPDTWRIRVPEPGPVQLQYRVRADLPAVSGSWTTEDFAFVNGTTVFLAVEGHPDTPARVSVRAPADWRVVSGFTEGSATEGYRARDVHELMDNPLFIGRFDLDSALVAERWMRLATWPEGAVRGTRRAALWEVLTRSVEPLTAVFGELPWPHYTVLQAAVPGIAGMSALEHASSELALVGPAYLDAPFVASIHAHELAHAWNVKRLRPAELWPYRYDVAQPTPWLWVSEGITDYYADLALLRSGLWSEAQFLEAALRKIDGVSQRPVVALEDGSLEAWIAPTDGTEGLYYDKGSLAGLALDILIRDISNNTRTLDHVMRELYDATYRQGRGFTHDDFWNAVARATRGRRWGDFERRYIDGRDAYPWSDWLHLAGWRLVSEGIAEPRLGAELAEHPDGVLVEALDPDGMGVRGGLRAGDIILRVGDRSTRDAGFGEYYREVWGRRPGAAMPVTVRRDGRESVLTLRVEVDRREERRIEPDPRASAKARRIRAGILQGQPRP